MKRIACPLMLMLMLIASIAFIGCEQIYDEIFTVKKNVPGKLSQTASGIVFGKTANDNGFLTADITFVRTECFPVDHPSIEAADIKRSKFKDYTISTMALVTYQIKNETRFDSASSIFGTVTANIIFEAMTSHGVVLGESKGVAEFIKNGDALVTTQAAFAAGIG